MMLVCVSAPCPLHAQVQSAGASKTDSAAISAAARKAQSRFERARAGRLTWQRGDGLRTCHEYVGRYCVWHDDADDEWKPPPPHRDVVEARDALLANLASAAAAIPGDGWIAGQRVAYLLEAGRSELALEAGRGCVAEPWWCKALIGLVHHAREESGPAEDSFAAAMPLMPRDEMSRWRDASRFMAPRDLRALAALSTAEQDSLMELFWWLADPLWMRAGNDRRNEHYARLVQTRIAKEARNVEGARWASDMEELLLRFGWPVGWERRASNGMEGRVSIVTHRAPHASTFVPTFDVVSNPWSSPPQAWELSPRLPAAEYSPRYARFDASLEFQLAVLPDGESVTVAAAFAIAHDSVLPGDSIAAALVVGTPDAVVADSGGGQARGIARTVKVSARNVVASLEAVAGGRVPRAARVRMGLPLALRDSSAIAISDPLLIDGAGPRPASRDAAIRRMLLPAATAQSDSIGVYFEASRLAPDVPVEITLSLEPERGGILQRIGRSLRLTAAPSAVRIVWEERPPADGRLARTVTLGFSEVPRGRYVLRILVMQDAAWGTSSASVERTR
ncbi:MAG TPA: hypothetical protein VMM77_04515 [Gemmatimonadaceae bacterium]|nr:hypothetical protein [Gemmatimonadaceae bacterium]